MPLFEFECLECGRVVERLAFGGKVADDVRPSWCPRCEVYASLKLKLNGSTFDLRGSGFHCRDYPTPEALPSKTQVAVGSTDG